MIPMKSCLRGETVDQQTVTVLVLAGIINITSQHDTIAELEGRIKGPRA